MQLIKSAKVKNKIKGNIGEEQACKYLTDKQYEIIERNYKNKIGEIDIVAKKNNRIYFIEVKKRETARFGYPREAVTVQKQQKIKLVAMVYLKQKRLNDAYFSFDVIEILGDNLTHIQNAF